MDQSPPFTNHLIHETSPYLLQHARNPVDWYPWGPEALERARREDRPIFLSIGYSACHWCHVMEHESFEDLDTAAVMNEYFVNIKVDREERPDLDHIYMSAVQMMTRHGGWPMSVFLTPDLEPFYGGTYFPPEPRHGMPSFKQILVGVADAWKNRRDEVVRSAGQLTGSLNQMNRHEVEQGRCGLELVDSAVHALERQFDPGYGGFGSAPKFPHPMDLKLCLRHWRRTRASQSLEMVTLTLDHMARGGIYDHLGGGFHRYSTDERWLVPHFEKMLYDNALLAQVYLEAYQATANPDYARVAGETLDYVLREMTAPDGGFYSTQDADSEGVEGKFFVWSLDEIRRELDAGPAAEFAYVYDVTQEGNWEGQNILNRPKSLDQAAKLMKVDAEQLCRSLDRSRAQLFQVRSRRVPPGRDDKILVSWNGLMMDAMARGYQVLGTPSYLAAAQRSANLMLEHLWKKQLVAGEGASCRRLLHCYKDGQARFQAYLDDYAALIDGLVSLYEADFDPRWLQTALDLAEQLIEQFWDDDAGSFYFTGQDHERLIARVRDAYDGATPSGNSLAALALLRLGRLTNRSHLTARAERVLQGFAGQMARVPGAMSQMLVAVDFLLDEPIELIVAGPLDAGPDSLTQQVLRLIWRRFLPSRVLAASSPATVASPSNFEPAGVGTPGTLPEQLVPMLAGKQAVGGQVTLYVCRNYACQSPVVGLELIAQELERLTGS